MAIGSGIGSSFGIATESAFNTGVTVSRFYEFTSESTNYNKNTSVLSSNTILHDQMITMLKVL